MSRTKGEPLDGRSTIYPSLLRQVDYLWDGPAETMAGARKMRNQLHAAAYRLGITIRTAIDEDDGYYVEAWVISRERGHACAV